MASQPRNSRNGSIATRLMLGVALIAIAAFGLTAAVSYWKSSRALLGSAQAALENLAQFETQRVAVEMSQSYDAVQTLAENLKTQRGQISRAVVDETFKQQVAMHPERAGMCVLFEPDAFDGKDAEFVDAPMHDATGRFMSTRGSTARWWASRCVITRIPNWASGTSLPGR